MGVDVRCEVCNKLVRHVEVKNIHTIKDVEVCDECDKVVRKIYNDFEQSIEKFKHALETLSNQSVKDMKLVNSNIAKMTTNFDADFKKANDLLKQTQIKYTNEMNSLLTTTRAEVGDKIMKMGRFFK